MIERPNTQYRIYRSLAVGDNQGGGIGAMTLPGTRIRGVIVDNPSGSWIQLDGVGLGFQPYIPPYTMAWSVSLLPSVSELSAAYVAGPIGQSSSLAGAPVVIYVFESQVPSSPGSSFATTLPPTVIALSITLPLVGPNNNNVILPALGGAADYRILNCAASSHYSATGGIAAVIHRNAAPVPTDKIYMVSLGASAGTLNGPPFSVPPPGWSVGPGGALYVDGNTTVAGNVLEVMVAYVVDL